MYLSPTDYRKLDVPVNLLFLDVSAKLFYVLVLGYLYLTLIIWEWESNKNLKRSRYKNVKLFLFSFFLFELQLKDAWCKSLNMYFSNTKSVLVTFVQEQISVINGQICFWSFLVKNRFWSFKVKVSFWVFLVKKLTCIFGNFWLKLFKIGHKQF